MKITLVDRPETRLDLLPLTFTRPISEIRIGILTIRQKWSYLTQADLFSQSEDYLSKVFPPDSTSDYYVSSHILPDEGLIAAIQNLEPGQTLVNPEGEILASATPELAGLQEQGKPITYENAYASINHLWEIFKQNGQEITRDYHLITKGRVSNNIDDPHTATYNENNIFIEDNVSIKAAILNAEDGPIYIGKNCKIGEGAIIQGPFAMGQDSSINMGAKIRQNTSLGPFCKIGGEVSNAVLFGYSNKAHDGFLGNSVIGEWCNIGADTNTSNLKNNYSEVKLWNYRRDRFISTGSQFCGLIMGDHSKCAINTMFNTGSVVGVAANIFGAGFPRTSVPSFSWGGAAGYKTFQFAKALESCEAMMDRRGKKLTAEEISVLKVVFEQTARYRIWENSK